MIKEDERLKLATPEEQALLHLQRRINDLENEFKSYIGNRKGYSGHQLPKDSESKAHLFEKHLRPIYKQAIILCAEDIWRKDEHGVDVDSMTKKILELASLEHVLVNTKDIHKLKNMVNFVEERRNDLTIETSDEWAELLLPTLEGSEEPTLICIDGNQFWSQSPNTLIYLFEKFPNADLVITFLNLYYGKSANSIQNQWSEILSVFGLNPPTSTFEDIREVYEKKVKERFPRIKITWQQYSNNSDGKFLMFASLKNKISKSTSNKHTDKEQLTNLVKKVGLETAAEMLNLKPYYVRVLRYPTTRMSTVVSEKLWAVCNGGNPVKDLTNYQVIELINELGIKKTADVCDIQPQSIYQQRNGYHPISRNVRRRLSAYKAQLDG